MILFLYYEVELWCGCKMKGRFMPIRLWWHGYQCEKRKRIRLSE